jgi:hypothetical protein
MTREELIAALEAATGPSRKLDAEIYKQAIGLLQYESVVSDPLVEVCIRYYPGPPGPSFSAIARYTASIDAALTLVPKNLIWRVMDWPGLKASANCRTGSILDPDTKEWDGLHTVPAIALCIAALEARAA